MDPIVKISDFEVIFTSQNVFYFFLKKTLEVVTIARYLNAFWFFDFSLLDILPKYMNPKIVSRSRYALHDLPKIPDVRGRVRTRTSILDPYTEAKYQEAKSRKSETRLDT